MLPTSFPPLLKGSVHIKVCGLTRAEDAQLALDLGASFIGLIFAEGTPRQLTEEQAAALLKQVRATARGPVLPVGVFVDEPIQDILRLVEHLGLGAVQLHHQRPVDDIAILPVPVVQSVRIAGPESSEEISSSLYYGPVLLDTFVKGKMGGTGKTFDHSLAQPFLGQGPIFVAGGLNPENIAEIIAGFRQRGALPYALDVSSGLESEPRIKSHDKVRRFFAEVQRALD